MDDLTGQIAVVPAGTNWVARGIAAITDSHVSHVVGYVGGGQIVSADPDGVHLRPATDFPNAIPSKFKLNGLKAGAAADWARAQVGKPYAFDDDALIGCERLLGIRFPRWVRRAYEDDGAYQCAQLGMGMLVQAGVDPFPHDPEKIGDVAPGDFEWLFVKAGWYPPSAFGPRIRWPW